MKSLKLENGSSLQLVYKATFSPAKLIIEFLILLLPAWWNQDANLKVAISCLCTMQNWGCHPRYEHTSLHTRDNQAMS
jgi:hypothetical protein